ncbi:MAG TPA: multicopper oxidase family protein [Longimicrobium sp.]|nr:multicopper oxidase family protein [Longimicrobium sp.]
MPEPSPRRPRRVLMALVPAAALLAVAAAGVMALTGAPSLAASRAMTEWEAAVELPDTNVVTPPLQEPDTFVSVNRVLNVTMQVVMATIEVPLLNGQTGPQQLRAWKVVGYNNQPYNGQPKFPGPTFIVQPGDSVAIVLQNRLPETTPGNTACMNYPAADQGTDKYEDCFHGPNWTNIHYHGFHVTPDSMGDDVLLQIPPGGNYTYGFRIPANQSPGTHWYHPHKHGSVAVQVGNGMSGAFIVRGGGLDSLTRSLRMTEHLLAVQRIDSALNLVDAGLAPVTLVNGQLTPTITMRQGEVQRWRLVDENITKTANFQIGFASVTGGRTPKMYDVARDGVQYAPANYNPARNDLTLLMAPGNRMDLFVQAPADTGLHVLALRSVVNRGERAPENQLVTAAAAKPLFYIRVIPNDGRVNTTLPAALPPLPGFLQNLPGPLNAASIDTTRTPMIVFIDTFPPGSVRSPTNPALFWLGNAVNPFQRYSSTSIFVPTTSSGQQKPMVLDSVQTWVVKNMGTSTNHPFHIHINPVQVVHVHYPRGSADPNAQLYADLNAASHTRRAPVWLDVVPLPLPDSTNATGNPGYVIIRQRYDNFQNADGSNCDNCGDPTGWFVMHCHILGHEERGMMQVIQIVRPGQQPTPPPAGAAHGASAGAAHRH